MTDVTSGPAPTRLVRPDRVHVGWRYAQVHPDPGPPPRRPQPPEPVPPQPRPVYPSDRDHLLERPVRVTAAGAVAGAGVCLLLATAGLMPWRFAAAAMLACGIIGLITGYPIWQRRRAVRDQMRAEQERSERERRERERRMREAQERHRAEYLEWERRRRAYESQREWYPVAVPPGVDRVDIVGGTLAGWAAAVTTMGAGRLAAGARLTVLDLSEGAVAHDLVRLAADRGDDPLVWVLPEDLPRLDLTSGLPADALADVLSLVVGAGEDEGATRDLSFDNAILERIVSGVFGGRATIPQITAALRALAQVGDPRDDLRQGLLTDEQLNRVTTMYGRDATDRIVIRRAWALEAQLRKLEGLGADPVRLPPSRLHVVSMDRRAGVLTNRILGTYVATALTHRIRNSPPVRRWEHTMFLCGAEKLRGDVLDRLIDACEATGTGLVLLYRSIPPHVRERLGRRGHAAVGFMRLGNAEDARVAAEHIGTGRRLLVAELTDAAGAAAPPDPTESGYASTIAYARVRGDALTDPVWAPLPAPATDDSALVAGISQVTAWPSTIPVTERRQTSRELLVEPHELQELPPTAMIFTHAAPDGRRILLVDANPGIITLPTAHSLEYEEYLRQQSTEEAALPSADANGTPPQPT
ncbi:hypothetical protein [Thermomonospora cellulosilytica]|uniref:Uncharacterized protein n=1 Tax=Thermomonospora cellulosilytica TaxID=1411118 RepID=A0A7W3MWK0_9ACTN|nr:hypothetical protein [Thermomonospora cellulosilytica]MBA9003203.1 hypothetical protein [Thermomonospora cellulosilytica]